MMNATRNLVLCMLALLCLGNLAAAEDLSGSEIKKLISGEKVYLSTPFGMELPLNYKTNGDVAGDVSGISAARGEAVNNKGEPRLAFLFAISATAGTGVQSTAFRLRLRVTLQSFHILRPQRRKLKLVLYTPVIVAVDTH